jgi:hypothetical protein
MTIELDDFITHSHSDEFSSEWEEQQKILKACAYEAWLDEQERKYWENLSLKSEGFSCTH